MKRTWVLEEEDDRPIPYPFTENLTLSIDFASQGYPSRIFKVISITPDTAPKMGFDEWW